MLAAIVTSTGSLRLSPWGTLGPSRALCVLPSEKLAIQGNGKIVAAGQIFEADFALARYNTGGTLDTTFSGDGKVTTDFAGNTDKASAVAIQGDGRIVAAGRALVSGTHDFALARYTCFRRTSRPSSIPVCP